MQAAQRLFREVGYERASMSKIADLVGGSKATLYGYFPSKEELFAAALLESPLEMVDEFVSRLDPEDDDIQSELEAFGRAHLRFNCSKTLIDTKRNALAQGANSTLGPVIYERGPRRTYMRVAAYLQRLIERGRLRSADPEIAALHLWGLLEAGVVEPCMYGAEPRLAVDEAVSLAVDVFLRAYGND
jgi:AcrR family transcriptional regulator